MGLQYEIEELIKSILENDFFKQKKNGTYVQYIDDMYCPFELIVNLNNIEWSHNKISCLNIIIDRYQSIEPDLFVYTFILKGKNLDKDKPNNEHITLDDFNRIVNAIKKSNLIIKEE